MTNTEETQFNSLAERIAALNKQNFNGTYTPRKRPTPPAPPVCPPSKTAGVVASANGSIPSHHPANPAVPSEGPSWNNLSPPRPRDTQSSRISSGDVTNQQISQPSTISSASIGHVSSPSSYGSNAGTGQRKMAPPFDPASLPPLPPTKRELEAKAKEAAAARAAERDARVKEYAAKQTAKPKTSQPSATEAMLTGDAVGIARETSRQLGLGTDVYNAERDPALQSGDTWGQVNVFEASTRDPWAYGCNITIDPVVNAVSKEQEVGVNVTRYAAPAIALQGYGASVYGLTNDTKPYQWQSYPAESAFGSPANGSAELIGRTVARFAIGAIAVTAKSNTNIEARGMVPQKGITLEVTNWTYLHLILGLTVGMQLLIAVVSILIANRVQTPADSQQFNTVNPSSIKQESSNLAQAQQRQQQGIIQQQKQVQRQGSQQKSFGKAPQPTDPIVEQKITQLLNSMRAKPSSPHSQIQAVHTKLPRAKKDEEEMEEDERLLASEEGTKLSSKERRQLRARAYRSRRKEYITQLEAEIAKLVNEIGDLRAQNRALADENRRLSDQSPFRQGR
ncbi:Endonuclease/exonuclease/phosphatase [Purpureocillium lavendulum]|uniref:Endonuclease/exonuclease/phosphatase n=1 Tax=Purpureocillium lavendulum TaxID=1247861 RepID=A0AB34FB69_9HYPO|nr:Endonuclease/exonuclease/phosphatase [Purpureocillium lavendulum]